MTMRPQKATVDLVVPAATMYPVCTMEMDFT